MFDVFEKIDRDIPFNGLPWFFGHVETITPRGTERVRAPGGGIAVQNRMTFQSEYFADRCGTKATETTSSIQRMLTEGVPAGVGTDAARVSSYSFRTSLYWLISGCTVGDMTSYPQDLSRETALQLFTYDNAWFSSEQGKKGQIKVGRLTDLATLSTDFFSIEEEAIKWVEPMPTVVDGKIAYATVEFDKPGPPAPPVLPDWSPAAKVLGHWQQGAPLTAQVHQCIDTCAAHAHKHNRARHPNVPVNDFQGFWGVFGCSCFAF